MSLFRLAPASHYLITLFAAATCSGWLALPEPVSAQPVSVESQRRYDIPAGALSAVLNQFADVSGIDLAGDASLTVERQSPGLQGSFTVEQGFARLLQGTGLEAVPLGGQRYTLRRAPAPSSDSVAALAPVQVQGRFDPEDEVYRTAGSSAYLSQERIERFRGTTVGDIFQGIPGVLVAENRNSGGLDVNIRGMQGQGRVPVLVDGARQETTVYRGYSGVVSRSYVDPDLIGGIQIIKGPSMSAQGTGAVGGLVSMRTLNASDIVQAGNDFGIRVRGQAIGNNTGKPVAPGTPAGYFLGNFHGANPVYRVDCINPNICSGKGLDDRPLPEGPEAFGFPEGMDRPGTFRPKSWAGSVALAKRFEHADFLVAFAERRQGNYYAGTHGPAPYVDVSDRIKLPFYTEVRPVIEGATRFRAGERIVGTNYESRSLLVKGQFYLPHDQELELSWLRYRSEYAEIMPSQITRFGNFMPITQPRNSDVLANTLASRYVWNPMDVNWLDLQANLWMTRTKSTNNSPSTEEINQFNNERETYKRWGGDLSNTVTLQGLGEHQLRFGLAYQSEDADAVPLTPTVHGVVGPQGERQETSLFLGWQWRPVTSLTLDAGLRYSRFHVRDDKLSPVRDTSEKGCRDSDGDGECDLHHSENRHSGTAPMASLTWEPLAGLQLYGRYAEALRMPSLFESSNNFSFQSNNAVALRPERAKNREVGINFMRDGLLKSNDRLRLKLAYFRNHVDDYLTRTSPNLWEPGGGQIGEFTMRNIDSVTFQGFELTGGYDFGTVYTEFGVTKYNKIEVCQVGSYRVHPCNNYGIANSYINNMIPPKWHGSVTLGARLFDRRLDVGVRGTFMGERTNTPKYNNDAARGFLPVIPWHSYRVFDLYASYRINDHVNVEFNLDNFTDRYYIDALSLGLIPAPGRTARLSVALQF